MENHTHFLKLLDFTPAEIQQFLDTAADLKAKKKAGIPPPVSGGEERGSDLRKNLHPDPVCL